MNNYCHSHVCQIKFQLVYCKNNYYDWKHYFYYYQASCSK